jgi:glycerol-3-phosphate acyltransferase PlsY
LFALIIWKHRGNIDRLVHGTEPKLTLGKRDKA